MSNLEDFLDTGWHRGTGYGQDSECDAPNGGDCSCGLTAARHAARIELAALQAERERMREILTAFVRDTPCRTSSKDNHYFTADGGWCAEHNHATPCANARALEALRTRASINSDA